jgi:hypothetical protein
VRRGEFAEFLNQALRHELAISPDGTGLYDPAYEHDGCGVGFVAHIKGKKSHHRRAGP